MSVSSSAHGWAARSRAAVAASRSEHAVTRRTALPHFTRPFHAMASFNVLAFILSGIALLTESATLSLLFPQAWGLSPDVWGDSSGRASLWLAAISIAAVLSAAAALRAPQGSRSVRAMRAATLFGFMVGVGSMVVVVIALLAV